MKTIFRHVLFLTAFVCFGWNPASAQSQKLMWDQTTSPPVQGYSVTVDGVRIDYQLTPAAANGACSCSIPMPFSGGRHTVVVGAYNALGESFSVPLIVAPVASAAGPYAGQVGAAVAVNGSGSSAPTGTLTSYSWSWGDGTTAQGPSPQASHTYASAGTFTIKLTVTDNGGATASATTTATISGGTTPSLPSAPANPNPASGSTGVTAFPIFPTLTWSSTGATNYTINFGTSNPPPQAATGITTASFAPASLLAGATYYWQIVARNAGGATTGPVWWFTTATTTPTTGCPCSLWTPSTTPGPMSQVSSAIELGLKFTSDISGFATGVRFYKYAQNTGTHIGNLWTASGTLLATVTFTGETASGWQQANFATPVAIAANTTYVVSYHTNTGKYAETGNGLNAAINRSPLHAPASSTSGGNGVYRYGSASAFPNQTYVASNYWVDPVVTTSAPADTTRPTVTAQTPASGATNVSTATAVTATFSEAMAAATINATSVRLSGPTAVQVSSTVAYDSATRTVTLTPTAALANATAYTATVKASVTDVAGNLMTTDATWSFTTAAATTPALPAVPGSPSPANAATGTSTTATLTWSATGATSYTVNFGTSNPPPQAAASITSASYQPTLVSGKTYFWQVIARNAAGSKTGPVWSFTTGAATTTCPCSLWTSSTTPGPMSQVSSAIELGLKFTSDISGFATGVRFYKYAKNTGTHVGHLWTASGTLLATVTFTGETASGWQQANFATPVAIAANTTYVVSYHTNTGKYAETAGGLNAAVNRGPLHAPSSSTSGGNGVYRYGTASGFPNGTYAAANYWVDVVIRP